MLDNEIPSNLARQVTPRALRAYATGLGLLQLDGVNGSIYVYYRPENKASQVVIPLDSKLDDYADMVSQAIIRLAEFDKRPTIDVLDHLLLPPADLLHFRDASPDAGDGTLSLDQAADLVMGIKKALLSQAHSVLKPQAYHPRLGRAEAQEFVDACRFGQTRRGSFVMTLACPLHAVATEGQYSQSNKSFARQVTESLMRTLADIANVATEEDADKLLSQEDHPFLSANFCEALVQMRPKSSASLDISASWSRAVSPPDNSQLLTRITLDSECFRVAENLAPRLRTKNEAKQSVYVGYVDILKGLPGEDGRPFGEVGLTLLIDEESLRARADLSVEDYETANSAHMESSPVILSGMLHRLPRLNRLTDIEWFEIWSNDDTELNEDSDASEPLMS